MRKKILAGILAVVMSVTMMPGSLMEKAGVKEETEAAVTLDDPRRATDSSMQAGQNVTYDCVWFGSYPQTEIIDQQSTYENQRKPWIQSSDYEVNSNLYALLENAEESKWDENGDISLGETKYRRINAQDATFVSSADTHYTWGDTNSWHYFRYEPIKWRVLGISDTVVVLLADKGLDDRPYNVSSTDTSWNKSTIRDWLNDDFYNCAFTSSEKTAIKREFVNNQNSGPYTNTNSGGNTYDKVYLLSCYDLYYSSYSTDYGFKFDYDILDEARRSKSSTFAKAMGAWSSTTAGYVGNCYWWLRSPGVKASNAAGVSSGGDMSISGNDVSKTDLTVRPVITLDPSYQSLFPYAGTVTSSNTVNEIGYKITYNANGGTGVPSSQNKRYGISITLSDKKPTKSGYDFLGWGSSSTSTSPVYNVSDTYSNNESITLYAIWGKKVSISYDANGGNTSPDTQTGMIYNSDSSCKISLSSTKPERDGYTFIGWNTNGNVNSALYNSGQSVSINSDTTLYAIWEKSITLSYDANGGVGAPASDSVKIYNSTTNHEFNVSNVKPLRSDYTFMGWSTNSSAKSASCTGGDILSLSSDTTLYAVWKSNSGEESGSDDPVDPMPQPLAKQTITASNKTIAINSKPINLGAKTTGNGKLSYSSSAPSVASISSSGVIIPKKYGTTTILIKAAETSLCKAASKRITVTVVPKKMTLTTVKSPARKTLLLKWNKDTAATKYEVQLCMKKDFKKNTLSRTYGKNVIKQKVKNMKSKTWYVRIRAWKKVGGKTYYGIWSSVKRVKIK